ncbi:hypothetical protein C0J52_03522 [Blattella germanica]|nr:hypothetical protein C0J52_03522 [Blattella germanica]
MADVSGRSYTFEERLVKSVWVHERQHIHQIMAQIMGIFQEPRKATLFEFSNGKVAVLLLAVLKTGRGSGRKKTLEETCAGVTASIEQSPIKSTRKHAAELSIPKTTMRDHMKKDLKVRPFCPLDT